MRDATLRHQFVGQGYYDLRLGINELILLQEKLAVGPYVAAQRLLAGDWLVTDIIETIRLALIGGGMSHKEAFTLTESYIKPGHLMEYATLAGQILMAALAGVEDEPVEGEADAPTI